jgi:hypothetical protein
MGVLNNNNNIHIKMCRLTFKRGNSSQPEMNKNCVILTTN